jgi:hypothetical protein
VFVHICYNYALISLLRGKKYNQTARNLHIYFDIFYYLGIRWSDTYCSIICYLIDNLVQSMDALNVDFLGQSRYDYICPRVEQTFPRLEPPIDGSWYDNKKNWKIFIV